jgi:group I intron endonuclease
MAAYSLAELARSGIYQIVNTVTGKRYVGSAVKIGLRWRQHRCEAGKGRHNRIFQNAWNKYGTDAFVFSIIEFVDDPATLLEREQHYIDHLKPEYNVAAVAGSNYGLKWSAEVRATMSISNKSVWQREGHREKMSAAHLGKKLSEEQKKKISEAALGRKLSPDHAAKIALANTLRNQSPEHRAKMSEFWKGKKQSPESIAKMVASKLGKPAHNRGKPMSDEQKAKQSAAMKAKYEDPAFREKIKQTTKAAMNRPDVVEKVHASRLRRAPKTQSPLFEIEA